ncbi:MAG: type II secretion system F family protein [Proteobacteria bacterium]|nr:type II secretion system F family protein [Pseudomonadota bacterium]
MTLYRYKALGKEGTLHKGKVAVESSAALKRHLEERGLSLITYSSHGRELSSFFPHKVRTRSLMDLCLHLEQFEKAGIPLKDSLEDLVTVQEVPKLKMILLEVIRDVERGILFSKALARHPLVFDPIFVSLIAVGEKTGRLSFVLQHLVHHLKWLDDVQAQILKAFRYPAFMAVFLLAAVVVLMTVLVPELIAFMQSFKRELPLSTWFLIAVSSFLSRYLFLLLSGVGSGALLGLVVFRFHPQGVFWKSRLQEKMPLMGPLRRKLAMARFCHLVAVMFGGGVDILQALQTARESLGTGSLSSTLKDVERFVREGSSLSSALEKGGGFPPMVIRMIKVGEQTSSLHVNLLHVKEYFDTTLKRHVDHMVGLIEPFMILTVGGVMSWIVYSVFVPLYETLALMDY